jgi:hypothetical protein
VLRRAFPLAAALLACLACGTRYEREIGAEERAVLAAPDELELFALAPSPSTADQPLAPGEDSFRGYRVTGRAAAEGEEMAELVGLVRRGINAGGQGAACFLPRHGLRARRGDATVDLVVCFECQKAKVYGAGPEPAAVTTASTVEPELSAAFRAHGLKVGDK